MREAGILGRNEVQMKADVLHYSPLKPSQISSSYWMKMGNKGSPGAPEGGASRLTTWRLSWDPPRRVTISRRGKLKLDQVTTWAWSTPKCRLMLTEATDQLPIYSVPVKVDSILPSSYQQEQRLYFLKIIAPRASTYLQVFKHKPRHSNKNCSALQETIEVVLRQRGKSYNRNRFPQMD